MSDSNKSQHTELATTTGHTSLSAERYEPQNLAQLNKYSQLVVRSQLCPKHIDRPEDAMMIIQRGAELGLTAMTALQNMYVFDGKVTLPASLSVGVVKRSGLCEYFRCTHSDMESASYETLRVGDPEPVSLTYTIDQANRANLLHKQNWKKYPAEMLRARCSIQLARMVYEDLLAGVYTRDELEKGDPAPRPTPTPQRRRSGDEESDAVDAEFVDAGESEVEEPVNWSTDDQWMGLNRKFHALIAETGLNGVASEAMREALKERRDADSFNHIHPGYLAKIVERLEGLDAKEQPDGSMAPRMEKILSFTGMTPSEATGKGESKFPPEIQLVELVESAVDGQLAHRYFKHLEQQYGVGSLAEAPTRKIEQLVEMLRGLDEDSVKAAVQHALRKGDSDES